MSRPRPASGDEGVGDAHARAGAPPHSNGRPDADSARTPLPAAATGSSRAEWVVEGVSFRHPRAARTRQRLSARSRDSNGRRYLPQPHIPQSEPAR